MCFCLCRFGLTLRVAGTSSVCLSDGGNVPALRPLNSLLLFSFLPKSLNSARRTLDTRNTTFILPQICTPALRHRRAVTGAAAAGKVPRTTEQERRKRKLGCQQTAKIKGYFFFYLNSTRLMPRVFTNPKDITPSSSPSNDIVFVSPHSFYRT